MTQAAPRTLPEPGCGQEPGGAPLSSRAAPAVGGDNVDNQFAVSGNMLNKDDDHFRGVTKMVDNVGDLRAQVLAQLQEVEALRLALSLAQASVSTLVRQNALLRRELADRDRMLCAVRRALEAA